MASGGNELSVIVGHFVCKWKVRSAEVQKEVCCKYMSSAGQGAKLCSEKRGVGPWSWRATIKPKLITCPSYSTGQQAPKVELFRGSGLVPSELYVLHQHQRYISRTYESKPSLHILGQRREQVPSSKPDSDSTAAPPPHKLVAQLN